MACWLGTTYATAGEFSVATTGANTPMLVGNVVALLSPFIFIPILTYLPPFKPQNYDWVSMASIRKDDSAEEPFDAPAAEETRQLNRAAKTARVLCVVLALCFIILWPMPLFGTGYVFGREFFTGWVVVGIIWLFCSSGVVVFLPLWQSRRTIAHTVKSVWADVTGKGGKRGKPEVMQGQPVSGDVTPARVDEKADAK